MIGYQFKDFLLESFSNGISVRELRLSEEEVHYIQNMYPQAEVTKGDVSDSPDGRVWYKIALTPETETIEDVPFSREELLAIKQERDRLLQELQEVKREIEKLRQRMNKAEG